ncbi:DUF1534 domain-containing protein [Pseudomonas syringae]|nr:DUF1534 domain-containing protein [Pseudomonas syringae]MCF5205073.1 DUF1534 domain-containing protein [Pseudomonas syringae]MCF5272126.1 DUF1534 domain-containing protein [Pseudomonas syringae]MCF5276208.1 DUF1534 domain-containing protein [Pseudomonas syringae]MCF5281315.1 DUF1534 domain-containing protein [Pseudomonas syringae]
MAGAFGRYDWEDAERPERHTHAEHGHDRGCCGYREQAHDRGCCGYRGAWAWLRYTSFLTLQRGNAFHDALRHSLSRSAMPMRRMGVAGGCVTGLSLRPVPGSLPDAGPLFQAWPDPVHVECAEPPVHCRARSG